MKVYFDRKFLNTGMNSGSAHYIIELYNWDKEDTEILAGGTIKIADCTDSIELNISVNTEEAYKNSMAKIKILKEALNRVEEELNKRKTKTLAYHNKKEKTDLENLLNL